MDDEIVIEQESERKSFDWTDWARMENDTLFIPENDEDDDASGLIVPQTSHKVPNSLTGPVRSVISDLGTRNGESIAVQLKLQNARTDVQDDMVAQTRCVSSSVVDNTPTPRGDSQCSEVLFSHISASEKDESVTVEDSEGEDFNAESTETELSSAATLSVREPQEVGTVLSPNKYQIEMGLAMMTPAIEAFVTDLCLTLKPSATRPHFDIHDEIAKMLKTLRFLEFYKTKRELDQYLENREKMPGKKVQARAAWDMSNPSGILDTLQIVKSNTADNKIHRAYGQTMLFSSVNNLAARGYKSDVFGSLFEPSPILEDLARKKAGPVSKAEIDVMISSYKHEYHAGQKWSAVVDWFGGSGVVLIFVTAGE